MSQKTTENWRHETVCSKVSMPDSISEHVDSLYTQLDQDIICETDDNNYVVKTYRRSWLDHMFERGILDKVFDEDGKTRYKVSHVAMRLECMIVREKAHWISLPQQVRDDINDKYIMNPDIWLPPRVASTEPGETVVPLEEGLKLLEASQTEYYYLAQCNCNNYIMGCERDKYQICIHFPDEEPPINSPDGRGLSKRVTKEDAIAALKYADKQGLIHKTANGHNFCNCCTCCCIHQHKAEKYQEGLKGKFIQTPYIIEINEESCVGCKACTRRCQFGALTVENRKVKLDADKCWGCGVCRAACPTNTLSIRKRELD